MLITSMSSEPGKRNLPVATIGAILLGFVASIVSLSAQAQTAPIAKLSTVVPIPPNALPPLLVTFNGTSSTCSSPCRAHFDFGDGNTQDFDPDDALIAANTYVAGGDFTATMTLTDGNGKKASASISFAVTKGQSLANYLDDCKQQLGFQDFNLPTNLSCNKSILFGPNSAEGNTTDTALVNDSVGYARITDNVDLTFACRWLQNDAVIEDDTSVIFAPPFVTARSIEMIIHNRQNGNTCFFEAIPRSMPSENQGVITGVPVDLVSLAVAARAAPGTPESKYWFTPLAVSNTLPCVDCHIAGPYIATPRVAPALAQFGLLNNGHDTFGLSKDANNNVVGKYHAVGTTLAHFNELALENNVAASSTCATGCHSIGYGGAVEDEKIGVQILLPSITNVIDQAGRERPSVSVTTSGAMRPYDDGSDYRWINLSSPATGSNGVDAESFVGAINATDTLVPKLFGSENPNCAQPKVPNMMEAHVVGSSNTFAITQPDRFGSFPDKLSAFNVEEGLICLDSDQDPGQRCQDYRVHYECTTANGDKSWTTYAGRTRGASGDDERRPANACPTDSTVTGIEAEFTLAANGWTYSSKGPSDRLANVSKYGLTCKNADQPDGQCSNYVVRYSSCGAPPQTQANKTLTNVFAVGKQVTAASNWLAKGQGHNNNWNTQQWSIEPVTNTEFVRLRSPGTNLYLNVASASESATVGTVAANGSTNQMWLIETVSGSTAVRLKNVFSGKYLTMADPAMFPNTPDYLPVFSQARNTGWTSQHWLVR